MKCHKCLKHLEPDWQFCPGCGTESVIDDGQPLSSPGMTYLPEAFQESISTFAIALAASPVFYSSFVRYILTMAEDVMQMGPFRAQLVADVRGQAKQFEGNLEHLLWCALSVCSDKYFTEKAKVYGWSAADTEDVLDAWYKLIAKAFVPASTANSQKLDIYSSWQEKFLALHKLEAGPLKTCKLCTAKCLYQYDVKTLSSSQETINDFQSSVNSTVNTASEAAAIFTKNLADRTIGTGTVDLAYCFSVNLLNTLETPAPDSHKFSIDAQVLLAQGVRNSLEQGEKAAKAALREDTSAAGVIRQQIFEVIVRQALAGAPWQLMCANPMKTHKITEDEIDDEIKRRKKNG